MDDLTINKFAQSHMGKTAWPTVVLAVVSITAYFSIFALAILQVLPLWVAVLLISYMVYVVYTALHESVHNNIAGSNEAMKRFNNVVGHIVGSILGIPFAVHSAGHMAHHRSTNVEGKDPDLVFQNESILVVLVGGVKIIFTEFGYYFRNVYPKANPTARLLVISEIAVAIGWRLGLAVAGYPVEALVLGIIGSAAGVSLLGTIFAWIVHRPFDETERYKNTSTIFLPRPIHTVGTVMWLWQNYHSIHHLFPRVPFYRYRKLYDQIYLGMKERGSPVVGPVPSSLMQATAA